MSLLSDREQIVKHPTLLPKHFGEMPNIFIYSSHLILLLMQLDLSLHWEPLVATLFLTVSLIGRLCGSVSSITLGMITVSMTIAPPLVKSA